MKTLIKISIFLKVSPFPFLKSDYTTRVFEMFSFALQRSLLMHFFTVFSATGPQALLIAVFTLTGAVVLLLLIALLVLRYLSPSLSHCAHHPEREGAGEGEV